MSLKGKVAVVTGGSRGIGLATVTRLVKDGYYVISLSNSIPTRAKKGVLNDNVLWVRCDISSESDVVKIFKKEIPHIQKIDLLVNNAGTNLTQGIRNTKFADFRTVLETNVFGGLYVTQAALQLLERAAGARIVYILSTTSFTGSKEKIAYVASKSALIGIVRALAVELAPRILVNGVVPGYIATDMLYSHSKNELDKKVKRILLQRLGKSDEVASVVSFLASPDAAYITGQCIHVNGGYYFS